MTATLLPKTRPSNDGSPSAPVVARGDLSPLQRAQVENHQGLVRSLALKVAVKLPVAVELDDLIGYGQIGLMQATRGFNPAAGVQFATYAHYRIRGAIFDGIGKMAWFGGVRAAELRADRAANDLLRQQAERRSPATAAPGSPLPDSNTRGAATDGGSDVTSRHVTGRAAEPRGDAESDAAWLGTAGRSLATVFLLSQTASADGTRSSDPVDPGVDPAEAAGAAELFGRLRTLVDALPEDAATLIRGVYFDGLSLKDAGARIGISRGWASRLHAKALARLGRDFRRTDREPASPPPNHSAGPPRVAPGPP